jgi:hypothetical protein
VTQISLAISQRKQESFVPRNIYRLIHQRTAAMAPSPDELHARLDAWWASIKPLRPDSSEADWNKMASYIAPGAKLYLNGVLAPPCIGPEGAIETLKGLTAYWSITERRVLTRAASADGKTLVAEMYNPLVVAGTPLDFDEIEVVRFDEQGRIENYRLHCDAEPIKAIFAKMNSST